MASLFKEIKPLVNATFEASQTINRTGPILAWTQALMIVLLGAIFLALFGLLVTINPDLEVERKQFITPAVRFLLGQIVTYGNAFGGVVHNAKLATTSVVDILTRPFRRANENIVAPGPSRLGREKESKKSN